LGRDARGRLMAALSPAESLFLLKPNRTPSRETVKVTLLSLLAQGMVRLEEQVTERFIGTRKTVYVRLTGRPVPAALSAHAVSLLDQVRAAQAATGSMSDVVKQARQAYGSSLNGFNRDFIIPRLLSRGLIEDHSVLFLRHYKRTPAGDAEESRIAADIARARSVPELLPGNPTEAAAIVLAIGGTILLVSELRPYYRRISEVMRPPRSGADHLDSSGCDAPLPFWSASDPGAADPADAVQGLDAASFGSLDLSSFDASAFDALDAGMASFDAGFDASVGDGSGGGGGGDGGGGDGGGGGGD
jgi:uncharacterized membrane protein YgcG